MKKPSAEYAQWLLDNQFSTADEQLILRTITGRMLLWGLLSCIPGVGYFTLPLFILAWGMRKIVKNRSFDHRPGLLFSLVSLTMYITFIMVIPLVIWLLAKKFNWGTGIRGLLKKGKIGNDYMQGVDAQPSSECDPQVHAKNNTAVLFVVIGAVALIIISVVLFSIFRADSHIDAPETTTIEQYKQIPNFSKMEGVEQIRAWTTRNEMLLQLIYVDENGKEYSFEPNGSFVGILSQEPAAGKTLAVGSTICVKIQVDLSSTLQELVIDSWHFFDYDLVSLRLYQLTIHEDGTFSTYTMGHLPVNVETDLYIFGKYWSGAMGAIEESGTYSWQEDNLILHYEYYDYELRENVDYQQTFRVELLDGTLRLSYLKGDRPAVQNMLIYRRGVKPDRDTPLPGKAYTGVWIFHAEPLEYAMQEWDSHYAQAGKLILYADGTFDLEVIQMSKNIQGGWYHMGGGENLYTGVYTVDNHCITLRFTGKYVSKFDDQGNWLGTELESYDEVMKLIMTSLSEQTEANFGPYGICDFERISQDVSYDGDWIEKLLDSLSQMYL